MLQLLLTSGKGVAGISPENSSSVHVGEVFLCGNRLPHSGSGMRADEPGQNCSCAEGGSEEWAGAGTSAASEPHHRCRIWRNRSSGSLPGLHPQPKEELSMTRFSKLATAFAAAAFCALAMPAVSTPAAATPATSAADMMRGIQSTTASAVEQVTWRRHRHWRHRHWGHRRCHVVRDCWWRHGHRHCGWVRRCNRGWW